MASDRKTIALLIVWIHDFWKSCPDLCGTPYHLAFFIFQKSTVLPSLKCVRVQQIMNFHFLELFERRQNFQHFWNKFVKFHLKNFFCWRQKLITIDQNYHFYLILYSISNYLLMNIKIVQPFVFSFFLQFMGRWQLFLGSQFKVVFLQGQCHFKR